jgi:hypothetical protein
MATILFAAHVALLAQCTRDTGLQPFHPCSADHGGHSVSLERLSRVACLETVAAAARHELAWQLCEAWWK